MGSHSSENEKINSDQASVMRHEPENSVVGETFEKQIQKQIIADSADFEVTEAINTIAFAIGAQYYALYHIWVESHTFICFNENRDGVLTAIGEKGDYDPALEFYVKTYVVSEHQEDMLEFTNLEEVKNRLRSQHTISRVYQQIGIGWTRGTFIAGKRDEEGNVTTIIYAVSDINHEIEREEKEKQALYEAEHDSLTGAYNRNGLDSVIASHEFDDIKFGFAIIDLDNFKSLNDNFGHDIGDQVLIEVAKQLTLAFRSKDKLFRLGGDEFAVLLYDCDEDSWDLLCRRLKRVHAGLAESLSRYSELSVTLSCGLCFSEYGYSEALYRLADEALYQTKADGRAGCTLIDWNHNIIRQWHDDTLSRHAQSVLEFNNTCVCQIELPSDPEQPKRLICGEAMKLLLGVDNNATAKECYEAWWKGVDALYHEVISSAKKAMMENVQAECTYLWHHPNGESFYVRSGGFAEIKEDRIVFHGYHHALKDTHLITRKDEEELLMSALSSVYFASYYLNLENNSFSTFQYAPGEDQLQMSDRTMNEVLDEFISVIVDPADRDSMRKFMDMSTLQTRLGINKFIDNEYRSLVLHVWCRARLLPIKYDKNGKLTHVLFVIGALDSTKSKELSALDYNRKSLAALFHNVPGGIVMYEWDGTNLQTLHISDYYEKEYSYIFGGNGGHGVEYHSVHPDDLQGYQKAITTALTKTHELHYEFRRWNRKKNRYVWVHLDATSEVQADGTSLVFALYTDVTERKEAELSIDKRQAWLEAALAVSDQICGEYDPQTHVMECLQNETFLGLPAVVYNYPECMRDYRSVHPNDIELIIKTAHSFDGNTTKSCTIRSLKNGEYRWFHCTFSPYYDAEKERNIAIFTMQDVTKSMDTMHSYEERLRSLLAAKEDALSLCTVNVSQDVFHIVEVADEIKHLIGESTSFETVILGVTDQIVGKSAQKTYRELFCRKNLLKQAAEGNMHIQMEHLIRLHEGHYEWITTAVDLVKNPITEEVVGVAYSKASGTQKMKEALLDQSLKQDYMFASVIYTDTDEFYMYNPIQGQFKERRTNYWERALKDVSSKSSPDTIKYLQTMITKEKVLARLKTGKDYTFSYNTIYNAQRYRLEIRYSYVDENHTMILATMRNVTDFSLLEQFRHDSEHDPLTDLYNRKTVFRKAQEIMDTHPEDRFAMAHVNIRHFRLYNTFFGEAAGDQLLCDMADLFRQMAKEYDYWVYGRIEADVFCAFFPYTKERCQSQITRALEFFKSYRADFLVEPAIGMYFVTERDMPIDSMFTRATLAARAVKTETPYATVVYDEVLEHNLTTELQIMNDMQRAIDEEQFAVYLQPKYALRNSQLVGAEALVRWIHPEKGMISPGAFIPVFESNGFITNLDHYMWEHVCRLLSKWKKTGQPMLPISVNVSRLSMYSKATVHYLKLLVQKYDIEPKYLELELTESAYIDDPEEMKKQMLELRKAGFQILLDDFGSGYSSLNILREMPVDVLKLDMKFLSIDQTDIRGGLVISSVVRMARLLNLSVIAEGVETQEQADYLKGVGCEYVQGYLFAKPMPAADFENILVHSDTSLYYNKITGIEHVGRILAEIGSDTYEIGTVIPVPLVCMEYSDGEFDFLRVNPEFFSEFHLENEHAPASKIFKKNLSEKSFLALIHAIEKSRETGRKITVPILWNCEDGSQCRYMCRIAYEGEIGTTVVFVAVFLKMTEI